MRYHNDSFSRGGNLCQQGDIKSNRCVNLGKYIIESGATVRDAAEKFGISKSTVHQDVTVRLLKINPSLQKQVREILEKNKQERHIRGGLATQKKYKNIGRITNRTVPGTDSACLRNEKHG